MTDTTSPTSLGDDGDPAITGWPTLMPSEEPLSIVTVQSKFDTPLPITTAGDALGIERLLQREQILQLGHPALQLGVVRSAGSAPR